GRTREALQQYESCRRMLEGQLGAKPTAALERARAAIACARASDSDTHAPVFASAIAQQAASAGPLIGRATELRQVAAAVSAAAAGESRDCLWITGEPGIGKTRLLQAAADEIRAAGGTVLEGRAYEAEMVRPFGPWIDALRAGASLLKDDPVRSDLAPL